MHTPLSHAHSLIHWYLYLLCNHIHIVVLALAVLKCACGLVWHGLVADLLSLNQVKSKNTSKMRQFSTQLVNILDSDQIELTRKLTKSENDDKGDKKLWGTVNSITVIKGFKN